MERLCACCGMDISVSTERRRLSIAEEVRTSLLLLISDCVRADNGADLLRGECGIFRCCFAHLQRLAKLQADMKALQEGTKV